MAVEDRLFSHQMLVTALLKFQILANRRMWMYVGCDFRFRCSSKRIAGLPSNPNWRSFPLTYDICFWSPQHIRPFWIVSMGIPDPRRAVDESSTWVDPLESTGSSGLVQRLRTWSRKCALVGQRLWAPGPKGSKGGAFSSERRPTLTFEGCNILIRFE